MQKLMKQMNTKKGRGMFGKMGYPDVSAILPIKVRYRYFLIRR
jgi:hypothetical protein